MALRFVMLLVGLLGVSLVNGAPSSVDLYQEKVKPLLEHKCYACHGALKQKGGLRLDTGAAIREGGDSGPAVMAGDTGRSLLFTKVTAKDESDRMPQEAGALTAGEVEVLRRWIEGGAASPADEKPMKDPNTYWSYQPIVRPEIPELAKSANPIDLFVAKQRKKHALTAVGPAEPAVLLRRVYLDLIGLPPTREELHRFLTDPSPEAYPGVVDDLLNRPQYGERWGRHWMDVWRYSDWYGRRGQNEIRYSVRHIWRWRDWIIRSLNDDKGYDQMIIEMLAGDEVAPNDPGALAATGFLGRNWYKFDRNVWLFETVEHTSQAFLGLTMRCARCHDHKYDPIAQSDYYRFRAFFEPHDLRTDPLEANAKMVLNKGADKVLAEGLSRVFDKQLDAPTWLFVRGDDRRPDKSKAILPGVPASLGGELKVSPVVLPVEAFYPALRKQIVAGEITKLKEKVTAAKEGLALAEAEVARAERDQEAIPSGTEESVIWKDDFAEEKKESWKALNGNWKFSGGKLTQDQVTSFATIVSQRPHPRDFRLRYRYRALQPGTVRSIGVSFDFVDKGRSQDFYTSTGDERQSVQAFHRTGGKQIYPKSGIVRTSLKVGEIVSVELEVRGPYLGVLVDGERRLEYIMPEPRLVEGGKLALWVHSGAAEFLDIELNKLVPTRSDRDRQLVESRHSLAQRKLQLRIAEQELRARQAQFAADRARFTEPPPAHTNALQSEAFLSVAKVEASRARGEELRAAHHLALVQQLAATTTNQALGDPVKEAEARLAAARQGIAEAEKRIASPEGQLEPLGEMFPRTSSGRRLALARWIASPDNPRTARIAINHIWLRHFGEALVATTSDFGMAGKEPSHPRLLDWLATELMANDWRVRELHRLMVTSETYRLASWAGPDSRENLRIDPQNRWYWRANSRRMEAEVVRDSVLAVAGELDLTSFGPEIDESLGMKNKRRSIYFRTTPDNQMKMLSQFDMANPNACYRREESVAPQQSLTLMNGGLILDQSRLLARSLSKSETNRREDEDFARFAFERILNRPPDASELASMVHYLESEEKTKVEKNDGFLGTGQATVMPSLDPALRARENLVHVLFNHNDFVTIR